LLFVICYLGSLTHPTFFNQPSRNFIKEFDLIINSSSFCLFDQEEAKKQEQKGKKEKKIKNKKRVNLCSKYNVGLIK